MEHVKNIILTRYKLLSMLMLSMTLSLVLLAIRMKLNQSFFFLFLVWNLFLAVIPFVITTYLREKEHLNKFVLMAWFGIWLLFLPNAPYIVTDLLHLRSSEHYLMWLDVLVVTSFAFNGLIVFFQSLMDMEEILKNYVSKRWLFILMCFVIFLTGFGMYLGRFLRYNSWEIIQHPSQLFTDIIDIAIHPTQHMQAWVFTLTFGAFLYVGFGMIKSLKTNF
ncbi:DUF1361 domain-containing protein [Subsaxibacter sp. CAU 1640]|uniref:DUF1361 domain-containing protein n=1 Tax=Subsaxibacter sp. CAU 1640 TaxID=2933271 RepID=UPI0020068A5C|nr:DUF1361 domain-containing protein [Subsaxibacter sp. CAU 1640]MCK7591485.1 DUF1361 domain-containing protein [Subsaxibacter sp. CAU 1640]